MPIFAALAGLSAASKLSIAGSVVNGLLSYKSAQQQRKQAIADQDNQYVRMRNAAQRAGFNPLTVMRATGGQGFTGLPTISKAAAFGNAAAGIFDAVRQSPIDKYNKKVRDLEIKQRKADLELMPMRGKLMKAQLDNLYTSTRTLSVGMMDRRKGDQDDGEFENRTAVTEEGMRTDDKVKSGWHMMELPNNIGAIPVPFDPADSDIGAIAGGLGRVIFVEAPAMSGAALRDLVDRKKADSKMRSIYRNVNADQILRALETRQNAARIAMKPRLTPPATMNHLMTLPKF
jgi:hypothetical protein